MTVKVTKTDKQLKVASPYHKSLPTKAKQLGGKWSGKEWVFDVRNEDRVAQLYREVYGEYGEECGEKVTVRCECEDGCSRFTEGFFLFGRNVASAFGRDSSVKLGKGVTVLSGGFESGGSVKNWKTIAKPNTLIEIFDVPKTIAEKELSDSKDWVCTVVGEEIDKETLLKEKERLLSRLAEIEELLK